MHQVVSIYSKDYWVLSNSGAYMSLNIHLYIYRKKKKKCLKRTFIAFFEDFPTIPSPPPRSMYTIVRAKNKMSALRYV